MAYRIALSNTENSRLKNGGKYHSNDNVDAILKVKAVRGRNEEIESCQMRNYQRNPSWKINFFIATIGVL
jgi:hypothetical protein